MNTTITIKNENGEYSVSAPIVSTFDGHLDLFIILMNLSGFNQKTIENGIVEKADEWEYNGNNITVHIEQNEYGYSGYYKTSDGVVSSFGITLPDFLKNLSEAASLDE